jgi:hypothetical protein
MRTISLILVMTVLVGCSQPPAPAPAATPTGPAENEIQEAALKTHLQALAADEMEGRAPSTPGGQKAAEYIAAQLKAMGVEPGGENGSYFQQVPIVESTVNRAFTLSVPGRTYSYFDDIVAFSGTEQARVHVQGDVVFVGHGIVAPEQKWNDYEGANVKGKWVLVMVNDPRPLDVQVRGSGAARRRGCDSDPHRRVRHLSVAGRPVVVEWHPVLTAAC